MEGNTGSRKKDENCSVYFRVRSSQMKTYKRTGNVCLHSRYNSLIQKYQKSDFYTVQFSIRKPSTAASHFAYLLMIKLFFSY